MKKVFFYLSILLFPSVVQSQEVVPLFEEMPSFNEVKKTNQPKQVNAISSQGVPGVIQRRPGVPNLGRNAVPLTSLKIAPFPDVTVDLDPSIKPPVVDKKFEEKVLSEDEILKRGDPLTMTEKSESGDEYLQRLIDERRLRGASGSDPYQNPLGLRYNADSFLISGVGLGMKPDEVSDVLLEQGYVLTKIDETLPPALSVQYEQECRLTRKLYILSEIRACINDLAKEEELQYTKKMNFERHSSRETVSVDFTSLATENVSYRVSYKNKGDSSLNSTRKNVALKSNRHKEFWNLVFSVYGLPDEPEKMIWGNENTSFLTATMTGSAYDGYIVLESTQLQNDDYFKWEDSLKGISKTGTFNFASAEDQFEE